MKENLQSPVNLNYLDEGAGLPVVFQHGLGGDLAQVHSLFGSVREACRLICMECVNHGDSGKTTEPEALNLSAFGADLSAFITELNLANPFILGGLSMGAALALQDAIHSPDRVRGLVLLRPAWLDKPSPPHLAAFLEIANFLDAYGPWEGKELFCRTQVFRELEAESHACAHSILRQFQADHVEERAALFRGIVNSAPFPSRDALKSLKMPVLILASQGDPLHPYSLAEETALAIPQAQLKEIPSKYLTEAGHNEAFQAAIQAFIRAL